MRYELEVAPDAARYLRTLDAASKSRIQLKLEKLLSDPLPHSKPLAGLGGLRTARVGQWRIIFDLDGDVLSVHRIAPPARCIVTSDMADLVLLDIDDRGVATITLNRPERLNAINMAMRDLLWTYFAACRDHPDVRIIVFKGNGAAFSAGADISEFGTSPSIMEARRARHERDLWSDLIGHRCITVAALHGYCYGAGLELPLCCDYRIATPDARFALPEVTLGYIPSACGTQTLPRTIPAGVAAHMILSGEPIGAEAALRWGLVDRIAERGLESALGAEVERLLAPPPGEATRRRRARFPLAV